MKELLMLERVVIESIAKGENTVEKIQKDTGLDFSLLMSIASRLLKRGLIDFRRGEYSVSKNEVCWRSVNRNESLKNEIKEVSDNIIDVFFQDKSKNKLKLQKVYIDEKDEKILNSLLHSVESFLVDLRNSQKGKKIQTKNQKVLMWGYGGYSDLIENTLKIVS